MDVINILHVCNTLIMCQWHKNPIMFWSKHMQGSIQVWCAWTFQAFSRAGPLAYLSKCGSQMGIICNCCWSSYPDCVASLQRLRNMGLSAFLHTLRFLLSYGTYIMYMIFGLSMHILVHVDYLKLIRSEP